ncbi:hypothetical protein ACLESO_45885 [Pyxidicoccus sp. 3LG]
MDAETSPHPEPRLLAWRIERAQAEQVDQTPLPGREGRPSLHVAGGRAIYTGPRALYSVAVGVGLGGAVTAQDVDRIEALEPLAEHFPILTGRTLEDFLRLVRAQVAAEPPPPPRPSRATAI